MLTYYVGSGEAFTEAIVPSMIFETKGKGITDQECPSDIMWTSSSMPTWAGGDEALESFGYEPFQLRVESD